MAARTLSWRERLTRSELEVALGGVQLRALHAAARIAARVRTQRTPDGVEYLIRDGRKGLPLACVHGFGGDKETWLLMSALVPVCPRLDLDRSSRSWRID